MDVLFIEKKLYCSADKSSNLKDEASKKFNDTCDVRADDADLFYHLVDPRTIRPVLLNL